MALATPAYRWSLVPVLTGAGFVSGVYTEAVIRVMSYGTANPYPFTFFGRLSLGLMLYAVLWAFGFVPSRAAAATLGWSGSRAHAGGFVIEQHDHICVFSRGDQDSARRGSIQCRVTSWMEAP